jgi:N-acetyl-alpha-D-muramate 1-phosphate uridylyltransferase
LLLELAAAGFDHATVVTGHLADQLEALVGDGSAFGLAIRTVRQPEAVGSADAVTRAIRSGATPPLLVTAADTVFSRGDLARVVGAWEGASAAGAVGVRKGGRPDQTPVQVEDGRVVQLNGPSGAEHTVAPLWILSGEVSDALANVPGPPYELARAVEDALAAGKEILALELRPTRDLTQPADVMRHNFPYLLRQG